MNGGETILNRIKADCDASVAAILQEAEKSNAAVLADADKTAASREADIAAKTRQALDRMQAASASRCELEIRNALLRQRRNEIDKTVEGLAAYFQMLGDEGGSEYFETIYRLAAKLSGKSGEMMLNQRDLGRLPGDFTDRLRGAGLNATVSQTPVSILGGFILKSGDVEENMDFAALISARRDELEDYINRALFAQ